MSLILISQFAFSQIDSNKNSFVKEEKSFIDPEVMAEFPGGQTKFYCFIDSLINKERINSSGQIGRIIVQFTISKNGNPTKFLVLKTISKEIDKELLRVLKLMPTWTPARLNGEVIEQKWTLPLKIPYKSKDFCR